MILFSRKIKCLNCGKGYKSKRERKNRRVYICSNYDNHGKCKREAISQDMLLELLFRRFNRSLDKEEIKEVVELIEVESKDVFTVHLKNAKPIVFGDNFIEY